MEVLEHQVLILLVVLLAALVLMLPQIQQHLPLDLLVELIIVHLHQQVGEILAVTMQLEMLVLAAVVQAEQAQQHLVHQIHHQEDLGGMDFHIQYLGHQQLMQVVAEVEYFQEIPVLLDLVELAAAVLAEKVLMEQQELTLPAAVVVGVE